MRLVEKQVSGTLKVSLMEFVLLPPFSLRFVKGSQQVRFPTPPVPSIGLTLHSTSESGIRLILILENCPPSTQTQLVPHRALMAAFHRSRRILYL